MLFFRLAARGSAAISGGASIVAPTLTSGPTMGSTTASIAFTGGSGYATLIPQYSTDNSNWTSISSDTSSPIDVISLTSSTLYYFRALPDNNVAYVSNTVTGTTSASSGSYGNVVNAAGYTLTDPTVAATYDFYVDAATGNNSNTGVDAAHAWADLTNTTLVKISAGAKVLVKAGTYVMPTFWSSSVLSSANLATPTMLIAAPGESVTWDCTNGSVMDGADNWCFWGGHISCVTNGFVIGDNIATSNIGFYYMTGLQSIGASDNRGLIFWNGTGDATVVGGGGTDNTGDYLDVQVCTFRGSYGTGPNDGVGGVNTALVYARKIKHYNIVGNILTDCLNPIYGKHEFNNPPAQAACSRVIKGNIIRNAGRYVAPVGYWVNFQHNVLVDSGYANGTYDGGGYGEGYGSTIKNNAFVKTGAAGTVLSLDWEDQSSPNAVLPALQVLKDNVFAGNARISFLRYDAGDLQITADYNLYPTGSCIYHYNDNLNNLASWQGDSTNHPTSTRDPNSVAGSCVFVSSNTSSETPADWAQHSTSAGYASGTSGANMGPNVALLLEPA